MHDYRMLTLVIWNVHSRGCARLYWVSSQHTLVYLCAEPRISWRFSLIEMQAILVGMIENFEFSLPPGKVEILRVPIAAMSPMVKGRLEEGVMMPLTVRPIGEC